MQRVFIFASLVISSLASPSEMLIRVNSCLFDISSLIFDNF